MMYSLKDKTPKINGKKIFIAPSADIIGSVVLSENSSVWFNATVRGDLEEIYIGSNSNIQDGSTIHTSENFPVVIGNNVTIGHNCVIHGCTIGDNTLIGMGSIILNGAKIGKNCIVAAGSIVTGKINCPNGVMLMGTPAKIAKQLTEEAISEIYENAVNYVDKKNDYILWARSNK